jgi:hypothetical protein
MTLYGPWLGGAVVQQLRQGANGRGLSAPSDISSRDFIGPIHASSRLSNLLKLKDETLTTYEPLASKRGGAYGF